MIQNIIFDIGNVLVDFCWKDHIAHCGYIGEMLERLGKAMMLSPDWKELDRGVLSEEEILQRFIANDRKLEEEIRRVFADLNTLIREFPQSAKWIRSLKKQGYRAYYLSNFPRRLKHDASDRLSFIEEMDGGILSYQVRLIKPDPSIYQELLKMYGLKAEESVFLDDSLANVEAARALGIKGILVRNQEQAAADLECLLEQEKS